MSDIDWDAKDINVVYDVFDEKCTRLGGTYNALRLRAREACDSDAVDFWAEQDLALSQERDTVHPDDRAAIVEHIERWGSLVRQLEQAMRAGAYRSAA